MEKEILLQNPWWKDKNAIENDEKLKIALSKKPPFGYDCQLENSIILGPIQVGKTTFLKFMIYNLIKKNFNPRNLIYFSCEPLKNTGDLIELFRTIDQMVTGKAYIFLDEITYVDNWERTIKYFLETDLHKDKTIITTGSNAMILKHGSERLPGRDIATKIFSPLSFKEFTDTFYRKFEIKLSDMSIEEIYKISLELIPYLDDFNKFLRLYLQCGGYLKVIYEFLENGFISEETYEIYVKWILGDLSKLGKNENIFRSIINGVIRMYSSSYSLNALAKEMEIPAHSTLSDYLGVLEELMLINNLYFFDVNKKVPVLRKQRKTYFTDPFLYSVFRGYVHGKYENYAIDDEDKIIEGIVLEHLARTDKYKNYNGFIGYYSKDKETDFVFCKDKKTGIEVKWRNKVDFNDFNNGNLFDEKILLSKTTFKMDKEGKILVIPLSIFLVLMGGMEYKFRG